MTHPSSPIVRAETLPQHENRSSSPRGAGVCDAVVVQDERTIGVMRLPEYRPDDFIAHFNRTYRSIGMKINPID